MIDHIYPSVLSCQNLKSSSDFAVFLGVILYMLMITVEFTTLIMLSLLVCL